MAFGFESPSVTVRYAPRASLVPNLELICGARHLSAIDVWGTGSKISVAFSVNQTSVADRRHRTEPVSRASCGVCRPEPHGGHSPQQHGYWTESSTDCRSAGIYPYY